MSSNVFRQLIEAQRLFQESLINKRGVVGVAVGYRNYMEEATDELALAVLVEKKRPVEALRPEDLIPRDLDGARTDVVEVGRLEAYATPRDRYRPTIPAGVSIGHYKVTAGTLGAIVFDKATGEPLLLSNNHVLANSNDSLIGDPILQPGPTDHGVRPDDVVAQLHRYETLYFVGDTPPPTEPPPTTTPTPPNQPPPTTTPTPPTDTTPTPPTPLPPVSPTDPTNPPTTDPPPKSSCDIVDFVVNLGNTIARLNGSEKRIETTTVARSASAQSTGTSATTATAQADAIHNNKIDAALARPNNPVMFDQNIQQIGMITGTKSPGLGMRVRKHGRTTGYTEGMITLMNATVNVSYNTVTGVRQARFTGQVITTPMSQGGDSGSLIVDLDSTNAVGLLFAGSSSATIFTPINVVLDRMNIRF